MAEKEYPKSIEAEASVLGAMLIDNTTIPKVMEYLEPESFYLSTHKKIYTAIVKLFDTTKVCDLVTLTEELKKKGELDEIGGAVYLVSLQENVDTTAHVEHHAKIVLEKSVLRRLISNATQIVQDSYAATENADTLLDKAEQLIFSIKEKRLRKGFTPIRELLVTSISYFDDLVKHKRFVTGVPSGYKDLDVLTSGFQSTDLIIVAGRPSMGKTSLVLNIAEHISIVEKLPVAIFSLEMSKELLVQRILFSQARVNAHRIRTGYGSDEDISRLATAAGILRDADIHIDDTPAIPILELRTKARRLKAEVDIKLLIVDYLQLVQGPKTDTRQQEIAEITRALKSLSKELNVPVVACSQLSRAVESREKKRPVLSDLRESGAIEQDADVVIFLYRPEMYSKDAQGIAELYIAKQRNGPTGELKLTFQKDYARFVSHSEGIGEVIPEYVSEG